MRTKLVVNSDQTRSRELHRPSARQSIGYEEFVGGLRPVVGADDSSGAGAGGFRLEARNGIFREVCAQAEAAIKRASSGPISSL
jgi:hypothetical protein